VQDLEAMSVLRFASESFGSFDCRWN